MSREDKEKLFNEHVELLVKRKRQNFRELLDETQEVTLVSTWKEIKKIIRDDPRYSKFASSERVSCFLYFVAKFNVVFCF